MKEHDPFQDADYLRNDQYRDSSNLNARGELHRRFSTNQTGWHTWVFDQLLIQPGDQILECGCGPGWLWQNRIDHLPEGCGLTLSDLALGMVAEARSTLSSVRGAVHCLAADIASLPFEDGRFDLVVANHILYHVPNMERAMAEVARVLRRDGRFCAATNGRDHMVELSDLGHDVSQRLGAPFDPSIGNETITAFGLEGGQDQLEQWFSHVRLIRYVDWLEVTEVEPIVAYMASLTGANRQMSVAFRDEVRKHVDGVIHDKGAFHITKSSGIFMATGFRSRQVGSS